MATPSGTWNYYLGNAQATMTPMTYNSNPSCCPVNWLYVLGAGIVGIVIGYVVGGHGQKTTKKTTTTATESKEA